MPMHHDHMHHLRMLGSCSYGYDPLGLGKDPANVEKYRAYELLHARWAMLAAAGIILPEGLQASLSSPPRKPILVS